MPYINRSARDEIEPKSLRTAETAGELNYQITRLVWRYVESHGMFYHTFNEIIGVLDCAKMEFYRRIVTPYEDHKQERNGDVYL